MLAICALPLAARAGFVEADPGVEFARTAYNGGASWGDYDGDGHLDLFVTLVDGGGSIRYNVVYRNLGDGRFELAGPEQIGELANVTGFSVQGIWADIDNDGDLDLYVVNRVDRADGGAPMMDDLFLNDGNGIFTRHAVAGTDAPDLRANSGSLIDFDGDGHLDLFLPDWGQSSRTPDAFFRNLGNLQFGRLMPQSLRSSLATSGAWADFDGDGDLDVLVANQEGAAFIYKNLLRETGALDFIPIFRPDESLGLQFIQSGCVAWGDFNNDGYPDVFIVYPGLNGMLLANEGGENHWLKLVLRGISSNGSGVGAIVRVKARIGGEEVWQMRHVAAGGEAWRVQHDMRPNFGLGDASKVDLVRIEWPSGAVQELTDVPVDQILTVTEPPVLRIEPAIILAWPIRAEGHVLVGAESLQGPWESVAAAVQVKDNQSTVTVRTRDRMRYYRLQEP